MHYTTFTIRFFLQLEKQFSRFSLILLQYNALRYVSSNTKQQIHAVKRHAYTDKIALKSHADNNKLRKLSQNIDEYLSSSGN